MLSPRNRRLLADYDDVRARFSGHPHVHVEPLGGLPPESYRVTFEVRGLQLDGGRPVVTHRHVCELRLSLNYPRVQPYCVAKTPIFHPNVAGHYCIADYWAAGQPLTDVIAKIGDMIQYRVFNTGSPLDAVAAVYADDHPELFPIGRVELTAPEVEIALDPRTS